MFRILALNCLIQAYGLSVLYLDGIKLGDTQATVTGLLVAVCFLCITRSQPLVELSSKKPMSNLFSIYMFSSVLSQFAIHLSSLIYVVSEANIYQKGEKPKPDSDFVPNLVNSGVFLIMTSMQVATFATNYVGHPFMESLRENKWLFRCLVACGAIAFVSASELIPVFNDNFQLVRFPVGFKLKLLLVMTVDFAAAFFTERLCRRLFASKNL